MVSILDFSLPSLPENFNKDSPASVKGELSTPVKHSLELLGPHFQAHVRRRFHNRSISEDEKIQAEIYGSEEAEEEDFSDDEQETPELSKLDPREWKTQDHYKVLGLSKYRYKASDARIKKAFHKKVLLHHPDKKAASGYTNDDNFFKCIQKAYELLTDPVKRRQFDSVDSFYPDTFPSLKTKGDFYELWTPIFERESRFSKKQPVPVLGTAENSRDEVEGFYDFWYNFESWRSFEYNDKEETDSDNRDQKRYTDRKNKADRAQAKKEDNARLLKLIDTALAMDPRIKAYKEEDKAKRAAKKAPKPTAAELKAQKAEEERLAKEKAEAEKKAAAAAKKGGKDETKRLIRKEKKAIRELAASAKYFLASDPTPVEVEAQVAKLDQAFEKLPQDLESFQAFKAKVKAAIDSGSAVGFLDQSH